MKTTIFATITFAALCASTTMHAMLSRAKLRQIVPIYQTIRYFGNVPDVGAARSADLRDAHRREALMPVQELAEEYRKKLADFYSGYAPEERQKKIEEGLEHYIRRVSEQQEKARTEPRVALARVEKQLEDMAACIATIREEQKQLEHLIMILVEDKLPQAWILPVVPEPKK